MRTSFKGMHRRLLLAMCFVGGTSAGLLSSAAQAQDSTQLGGVVVTGSMIKRADAETAEAVTILKADALKEQGIESVEQIINLLTSNNTSVNIASVVGSFDGGGTYANLRGLGNGRTLVLLNGERLAPNAFNGYAVDLGGIPFSAIDRVEVLREGASALYGADAIAGVINFITKKSFHGGTIQVNVDAPQKAGGESHMADITLGHGNLQQDGYNALATVSFSKQQELRATQRPFSAYGLNIADGISATNNPYNVPGDFIDANGVYWQAGYPTCTGNQPQYLYTADGDCQYKDAAATDLMPESHEISTLFQITKTLPANNELKLQYFWAQSEVDAWSGPISYALEMNPDSPYVPSPSQLTCDAFNNAAGACSGATPAYTGGPLTAEWTDPNNNRYGRNVNTEQRILLTFSGSNAGWDYSADLNLSRNFNDNQLTGGYPNESILAPTTDSSTGLPIVSNLINPFGPQSAAGQALINSSYVNGTYQQGTYTRFSFGGTATHPLGDAFNAGTPATLALGTIMSTERYANATTPINTLVEAFTAQADVATSGFRQIQAVFVELDVPMSKSLDLDVSDREDRYSDFGTTNNGKVQLLYHPTSFLTVRGTASTGFRAPSLHDLYLPNNVGATGGTMGENGANPYCSPGNYTTEWSTATCNSQGLQLQGGNKNLTPETSKNFDLGLVLSPTADLGVTLDYFHILLSNTIGHIPYSAIYGNPSAYSNDIVTATSGLFAGTLPSAGATSLCVPYTAPTCGYVIQQYTNTGFLNTSGFDLSVQYKQRTPFGTFHEDLEGTWVTQFKEQLYTGGPVLDLLGNLQIAYQNPAFRWQHNVNVSWTSPGKMWGGGLSERYYSGYADELPNAAGAIPHVTSYSLIDGFASVTPFRKFTVLFGIKNILNTSPPLTNAYQNNFAEGYNALIADPRLRNFYINLKYDFL